MHPQKAHDAHLVAQNVLGLGLALDLVAVLRTWAPNGTEKYSAIQKVTQVAVRAKQNVPDPEVITMRRQKRRKEQRVILVKTFFSDSF